MFDLFMFSLWGFGDVHRGAPEGPAFVSVASGPSVMQRWEEATFIIPTHNSATMGGSRIIGESGNSTLEQREASSSWAQSGNLEDTPISTHIPFIHSSV